MQAWQDFSTVRAQDLWLAEGVETLAIRGWENFTHYRDYLGIAADKYTGYRDGTRPGALTPLEELLITREGLLQDQTSGHYFSDENGNGRMDAGEERDLLALGEEYIRRGYSLKAGERAVPGSLDELLSDSLRDGVMGFFSGEESLLNYVLEEAAEFNRGLAVLMETARLIGRDLGDIALTRDDGSLYEYGPGGDFGTGGLTDLNGLITGIRQECGVLGGENAAEIIALLSGSIGAGDASGNLTTVEEKAGERYAVFNDELREARDEMKRTGKVLAAGSLGQYLEGGEYRGVREAYDTSRAELDAAESAFGMSGRGYAEARENYRNQLEILTILYDRLEEARREKETREALYDYASTAYLYSSRGRADGRRDEADLVSDAWEDYEEVERLHADVMRRIAIQAEEVIKVREQDVMKDAEYVRRMNELKEKADRAFRMEKLRVCMEQEVKKRSIAWEAARAEYEKAKNRFLSLAPVSAGDEERIRARDELVDRLIDNDYFTGRLQSWSNMGPGVSLKSDLATAAYYYNDHSELFGLGEEILKTERWFGSDRKSVV